jgi:hypothetical protein
MIFQQKRWKLDKYWILLTELKNLNKGKLNLLSLNPIWVKKKKFLKQTDGSNLCYKFSNNYKIMESITMLNSAYLLTKEAKILNLISKSTFRMSWMKKIWPFGTLKKLKLQWKTITTRSYLKTKAPFIKVISMLALLLVKVETLSCQKLLRFLC